MAKFGQKSVAQRLREIEELVEKEGIEEAGRIAEERNLLPTASERKQAEKIQAQKAQPQTIQNVNNTRNQNLVLPTARENNTYLQLTGSLQKKANDYVNSSKYAERKAKEEKEKLVKELKEKRYELEKEYRKTTDWLSSVGGQGKYLAPEKYTENEQKAEALKKEINLINNDLFKYEETSAVKKTLFTPVDAVSNMAQGALSVPEGIADLATHGIAQIADWIGNDEYANQLRQNAQKNIISDKVFGESNKYLDKNSYLNETGDAVFQGVGYSAVLAGLNLMPGGKVISNATLGASAMGGSLNEAYSNENISDKKAWTKSVASAGLEVGVEQLFGVLGYGGSSIEDAIMKSTSKIKNGLVKAIAQTGVSMTGEGAEEMLSYAGNYLIDHGLDFVDKSSEIGQDWDNEEIWKNFFIGAMSAGISQAPANLINYNAERKAQKAIEKQNIEELPVARKASKNIAKQDVKIEENISNIAPNTQVQQKTSQNVNIAPYNNEKYVIEDIKAKMQQVVDSTNKISKSDVKLEFAKLDGNIKAQTDGNTIKIDISKANLSDVIHEITHNTENSKGYLAVSDYILTELDKRGELQGIKDEMNTLYSSIYEQEGRTFTEKDLENEIVANYTEKFANDEAFVNKITQTDRNFAQKIYDWIKEKVNYYKTVSNMTDEQRTQYDELKRAEKLWMKALKENENSQLDSSKYSFAGQKGMSNAINNDYRNKNIEEMYNKALSMSKVGVNNETIRKTTNWYQDKNGDWKFEFSDKDMSLKNIKYQENKVYKLGDILEHDTLFMLYPELANYDVEFASMKSSGRYSKITKQIKLNSKLLNRKLSTEGTLIHEIQHAIQDIEGFEIGTNTLFKEAYYNNLGEVEAADTKHRLINERKGILNRYEIAPESSKALPKHLKYDNYIKNRKLIDKIKDSVYNYFNEKVNKSEKNIKEIGRYNYDTDSEIILQNRTDNNRQTRDRLGSQRRRYVDNTLPTSNADIRYSIKEDKSKKRKHYKSIATSEMVGEQGKKVAKNLLEKDRYIPVSNAKQIKNADMRIKNSGLEMTLSSFKEAINSGRRLNANDLALGEKLIQEYSRTDDLATLNNLIQDVALIGTEMGQSVQALSLIKKMGPEGQLMTLQKAINRINSKENLNIKLSEEQTKQIVNSKNQTELDEAVSKVTEEIAEHLPLTLADKTRSWRYLAMLGNPKTHIRNILSNVAMKGTMGIKDKIAGVIEDVVNPTERTRTIRSASKKVREFAKIDAENMAERIANGGKYDINSLINQNKKQFDSKIMNVISDFNSNALEFEDKIFIKSAYKKALANYMTANKLTSEYLQSGTKEANIALTKAREFASYEAQVATFRQYSWLASQINQIENKNSLTKIVVGGVLPFKKTPINIAKAGIEYSPVGLLKTLTKNSVDLKKGNITTNQYIDNISKGLTGTSIAMIGYILAEAGILKGTGGDNDKESKYMSGIGNQEYAIKLGDKTFTIDWLSPSAMPLLVGAEFSNAINDNELSLNATVGTLTKTLNPLVEMSMLQSFVSTLQSFNREESKSLADMGMNMVESYAGQYMPTALGQLARVVDDTERNTYYTDKKDFEARLVRFFNKQLAKIPFASKTLQPRVDIWGEEVKRDKNIALRAFNQVLNPSYVKKIQDSEADREVQRLYKASEDAGVLPKAFNTTFNIEKSERRLTPKENTEYAKKYGKTIKNNITQVANSKEYNSLPTADKAKTVKAIYNDSNDKVKGIYATEYNLKFKSTDDVDSAIKDGLSLSNAYIYRGNINSIQSEKDKSGETIAGSKSANKAKYIMKLPTADEQKNLMLGLVSDSETKPTVETLKTIGEENYTTYFSISNSKSRTEYVGLVSTGMNSNSLNNYISRIGKIESNKDKNGNTIKNSLKYNKANYINTLDLTTEEKMLLFAKDYEPSNSDKAKILQYINSLNISIDNKYNILKQLKGITADKNGNIKW